jgi:pyridoxal phosphate enzyme (YggS family)
VGVIDPDLVAERLDAVRQRIRAAGGTDVRIVAVTKTFGIDAVNAALAAGADGIGENKAQELVAKLRVLDPLPPVHFVGRLQTNKVRSLVPFVRVYESVDRTAVAKEIAKRAQGATVLVQVNATGETDKGGVPIVDAAALVDVCRGLGLLVAGLMTVGPTVGGAEAGRPAFRAVRALRDELGLAVCSMGMSDDFEVAVEEGSTQVRVGSVLFGARARG